MSQSRLLGGNIGLAIATVVQNQHLESDLQGILSNSQIDNLRHSLTAIKILSSQQVQAFRASFADAFRTQMEISMCVAAAALVSGICVWQRHPPTFAEKQEAGANETSARSESA